MCRDIVDQGFRFRAVVGSRGGARGPGAAAPSRRGRGSRCRVAWTGCRRGEVVGLRGGDVDLSKGSVVFGRSFCGVPGFVLWLILSRFSVLSTRFFCSGSEPERRPRRVRSWVSPAVRLYPFLFVSIRLRSFLLSPFVAFEGCHRTSKRSRWFLDPATRSSRRAEAAPTGGRPRATTAEMSRRMAGVTEMPTTSSETGWMAMGGRRDKPAPQRTNSMRY